MPLKTWIAGDKVNASDLNKVIQDALKGTVYDYNAGETIDGTTTPVCVYIKHDDSELYKTDASFSDERLETFIGMILNSTSDGNEAELQTRGVVTIPSVTMTSSISATEDQKQDVDTSSTCTQNMSAVSTDRFSIGFKTGAKVGNIKNIKLYVNGSTPSGVTAIVDLYAMDSSGEPTGSSLGTSGGKTINAGGAEYTFVFSTPIEVVQDTEYCAVLSLSAITSGTVTIEGSNGAGTPNSIYTWANAPATYNYYSSNSGSTWSSLTNINHPYFIVEYTEKQHFFGDNIFLSETAGEYTLDVPDITSAYIRKIGRLLNQTSFLLEKRESVYLGEADTGDLEGGSIAAQAFIHAPARALKATVKIQSRQSADESEREFDIIKGETQTVYVDDQAGDYGFTLTWTSNMLHIGASPLAIADFRAFIKFYT